MAQPQTLPQLVDYYTSEAKTLTVPSDIDPYRVNMQAESLSNELKKSKEKDHTPNLQVVPRSANVLWTLLFATLLKESYRILATPGAKVPEPEAEEGITVAVQAAEDVRRQLAQAIDGNKSNPQRSARLRARIFASRTFVSTKAGMEAELRQEIAAIHALGDDAPPAVVDMLEPLERTLKALDEAKPAPTGRPGKPTIQWSVPVLHSAMALNLAIGDLLSSAASKATPKRNAALVRIATPRRRDEERSEAATLASDEPGPIASGTGSSAQTSGIVTACDSDLPEEETIAPMAMLNP